MLQNSMMALLKMKRALFVLLLVLLSACAPQQISYEEGGTLAVWDLDNFCPLKNSTPDIGELLSGQIIETLQGQGDYTVVERNRLLLALEELHLGNSALVDESTRLKLGRMLGARFMVFGGYQIIGEMMRIDLRIIDVETGKVLRAVQNTALFRNLPDATESAQKAARELVARRDKK